LAAVAMAAMWMVLMVKASALKDLVLEAGGFLRW
jgi:hypothetical protein